MNVRRQTRSSGFPCKIRRTLLDYGFKHFHFTHTQIFTLCKIYRQSHKDRERGEMRETEEGKKKEVTFLIECFFSSEQSRAEYKGVSWCQHTHNTLSRVLWQILLFHSSLFSYLMQESQSRRRGRRRGEKGGNERKKRERGREKTSPQSLSPFLERARAPAAPPV